MGARVPDGDAAHSRHPKLFGQDDDIVTTSWRGRYHEQRRGHVGRDRRRCGFSL